MTLDIWEKVDKISNEVITLKDDNIDISDNSTHNIRFNIKNLSNTLKDKLIDLKMTQLNKQHNDQRQHTLRR